ncbi:MAG: hypothetical protein OJF49_001915 [Ktedonobacterales bacterium]|jgi:hypothetical protein|nr:MAG: hypothetical protein OJF49_001915 [Ktedonobacterales bacterium]
MRRRALLVGINTYDHIQPELSWCIDDTLAMHEVLAFHANHDPNFACHLLLGSQSDLAAPEDGRERVTFNKLRLALEDLFAFDDMAVFYFSGHGIPTERGRYLATQDGTPTLPGILMNDLLDMANTSRAREVVLIIDCCFAGGVGEPNGAGDIPNLYLRPGVTLLAAAQPHENALEMGGQGVFTRLVLGALKGGAADVRGRVSAASIYAHIEQALGPWDQRPIYKSNASQLSPLRYCWPDIGDDDLRRLTQFFPKPNHQFPLDPSYEVTRSEAIPEHVAIFKIFKRYQVARLLRPSVDDDLYFAAIRTHPVELTPLGQFYWQLAKDNLLGGSPAFTPLRRGSMPDAESVAKFFHEAYERLAPAFGYKTRDETRVPWENVPERNKRLMIAATAEVLAMLFPPEDAPTATGAPPR